MARRLAAVPSLAKGSVTAPGVSWAAYSVLLKRRESRLGLAERLAAITASGVLLLIPFTLLEIVLSPQPPFGLEAFALVATAALLPGVFAYTAYSAMQRELGGAR